MHKDSIYMHRALQLAKIGLPYAMPNPSVGAVIVYKDTIIGEGFTSKYGGFHAEVNAINSVKNQNWLKDSTLYITLEPCSHFGKTPPCANLIVEKKIPKVIIGCTDPNELVAGKGIDILKNNNVEVTIGVLEEECKKSHQRFFSFQHRKRPYIILKWAQSTDGFIAPLTKKEKKPVWLSNTYSRQLTHKWRSEEQAILVGKNTVWQDNPSLTTRDWYGKNPIRIFIDKNGKTPKNLEILSEEAKSIQFSKQKNTPKQIASPFENITQEICNYCFANGIQSIIVEGGRHTIASFIEKNLWDEARVFQAPIMLNNGIKAPTLPQAAITKIQHIEKDILTFYQNTNL